jgi:peptide/nickel transport system permease protein
LIWLRRAIQLVITLFLVTFLTFMLTSLLPGNPAYVICGSSSTQCVNEVTTRLGLNHSTIVQYWDWLKNLLTGNLGYSYTVGSTGTSNGVPISTILSSSWQVTVEEILYSQVMALVVSIPLAMWAALRANKLFDRVSTTVSFGTLSLPPFIIAPLLVLLFTVKWSVFPGVGTQIPSLVSDPAQNLWDLTLPCMVLALTSIAVFQRLLRADMITTLEEDYIVMARAKGLTTSRILFRHALRPSTFTLMTVAGVQIGGLITGAVIVEYVFHINGLGSVLTNAVSSHDYPVIQIVTVIVAVAYIVINLAIDSLYSVIDPRIRRARASH